MGRIIAISCILPIFLLFSILCELSFVHVDMICVHVALQLDLLTKMRDNKIYENRERFQRHAQQPASFSSFQIQEYLKASAFR